MNYASEPAHTPIGEAPISRDRYNKMRFSVIGLGLALIAAVLYPLFDQPEVVPLPPVPEEVWMEGSLNIAPRAEDVDRLEDVFGIHTALYINGKSQIWVTKPDGTPRAVCADLKAGEIVQRPPPAPGCGLNGITPRYFQQILYFAYNPGCTSAGGKLSC